MTGNPDQTRNPDQGRNAPHHKPAIIHHTRRQLRLAERAPMGTPRLTHEPVRVGVGKRQTSAIARMPRPDSDPPPLHGPTDRCDWVLDTRRTGEHDYTQDRTGPGPMGRDLGEGRIAAQ